ncbi:MAG: hypothetical protein LBS87_01650 [Puniceicoccales bacterium]|nr:hypothetical protein [Puniceicoccales bacterium]
MSKLRSLKRVPGINVRFNNVFIGKLRVLDIKVAGTDYFLTCHECICELSAKVLIGLKIANFDSVLALKICPDLKLFDERFSDIDLELLPEDVRVDVAALVFKNLLTELSAKLKLDVSITSIAFRFDGDVKFDHEIGWSVYDAASTVILCGNLRLGSELLEAIVDSFEKIPASVEYRNENISFDVFLETGRTELSRSEFDNLEVSDIVFLDDDSQLRSGTFTLCGVDSTKIIGNFEGTFFKVSNIMGV